ncbi:hypothetical protein BC834DRAFT_408273 [Gloeopeniophorella convolvens]|nr:hypothetical protein BC834DRAFT_408273 [Gloeopeniophorella convolvens]
MRRMMNGRSMVRWGGVLCRVVLCGVLGAGAGPGPGPAGVAGGVASRRRRCWTAQAKDRAAMYAPRGRARHQSGAVLCSTCTQCPRASGGTYPGWQARACEWRRRDVRARATMEV